MNAPKLCTKYIIVFEVITNNQFRRVECLGLRM